MASSFVDQIPTVIWVLRQLQPATMLDVGKGFGKYAFLAHEYLGIPLDHRPDPTRTLAEQSNLAIDAVEIQPDYLWPHIPQLYRHVTVGDITELYPQCVGYDVVLMTDVIEHLEKDSAATVLRHFVDSGAVVVLTTPTKFFHQDVLESPWERHRSHWTPNDFQRVVPYVDWQTVGQGRVYILANSPRPVLGFGHAPLQRARRLARMIKESI